MSETQQSETAASDRDPGDAGEDGGRREAVSKATADEGHHALPAPNGKPVAKRKKKEPKPAIVTDAGEEEPQLLPVGNPLRLARGPLAIVVGASVAFCLMAVAPQLRFGVPISALSILVATFGVLDLAGTFDDPDDRVAGRADLRTLVRPLGMFLGGALLLWLLICLAVDGRLTNRFPIVIAGIFIPASFLLTVVGGYEIAGALGV